MASHLASEGSTGSSACVDYLRGADRLCVSPRALRPRLLGHRRPGIDQPHDPFRVCRRIGRLPWSAGPSAGSSTEMIAGPWLCPMPP